MIQVVVSLAVVVAVSAAFEWRTDKWSDCQIAEGACKPGTSTTIPVYGHKKRHVWCSSNAGVEAVEEKFCEAERRPHSTIVCFGHCPRCVHLGPWSSWSPLHCDQCVGRQRRQLECEDDAGGGGGGGLLRRPLRRRIEEERACFSPSRCSSEAISQSAISQPPLRPPEALTASFVPYLHVGPWSQCQPHTQPDDKDDGGQKKRKKRRRRRQKRDFGPPQQPRGGGSKSWPPELPGDLEITFVANSVPPPEHGVQHRSVECRGQDGEELPFRVCVDGHSHTVVPTKVRSCVVSRPCATGPWSEWRPDDGGVCLLGGRQLKRLIRTRQIEHLPQGQLYHGCPHLREYKKLTVIKSANGLLASTNSNTTTCKQPFTLVASGWSQCKVRDMSGNVAICGGGLQDRNVSCLKTQGRQPVDLAHCSNLPQIPRVQRCFFPCVDVCHLGLWSEWSSCIPKDCPRDLTSLQFPDAVPHALPGKQTRRRRLESSSLSEASSCPHLEESRDCSISSCRSWRLEQSEECFLPKGRQHCGAGTRKLLFACVDHVGSSAPLEACSHLGKPPYEEPCHIQCPSECVLSSWTDWSDCPSLCHFRGRLPLTYRNRTLLGLGGQEPQDEACQELSEVRVCKHQTDCDVFHWRPGLWSSCVVLNRTMNCGSGIKRRDVVCVSDDPTDDQVGGNREVPDWRCQGLRPPILEDACFRSCTQDCQLTQWSEWSSCQHQCGKAEDGAATTPTTASVPTELSSFTVIMNTQSRYRSALQWPRNGGKNCPRLMDVRPCPLQLVSSCQSRYWRPQPWSSCLMPEGKTCGEGIRTRGLDCIRSGSKVDMTECLQSDGVTGAPLVPQHEICSVDCVSECISGPWSPWSACTSGCPSSRTRSRPLGGEKCTKLVPAETEEEPCRCQEYRSVPGGEWSQCILEGSSSSSSSIIASPFCGIGKRYRRLDCLDMSNQLAEPIMCGIEAYETESCMVACPMDCLMSPWTEWGLCDSICGVGLKNRTSKVLRLASVGGRPCPGPSVQYATCNYPCESFVWTSSLWSQCNLAERKSSSSSLQCGRGRKTRTIRCVERTSDGLEMDVPSHYCDPEEKPSELEDCRIFCPDECVVSEWTSWSPCNSAECLERSVQIRNRTLLRQGDLEREDKCSDHIIESRACAETCFFRYEWALTAWSSCQPVGDSSCGEGKRRRGVRCIRLRDGRPVRDSLCHPGGRPKDSELETWCPTDCPVDCEVSSWSKWATSSCECGRKSTNMTRTRIVTTEASPTGRPCPSVMTESRACPSKPCYDWIRSPWTCDLQGAACGHGTARRNVSCSRLASSISSSQLEDIRHCSSQKGSIDVAEEEELCLKSCPTDCILSVWSSWSDCTGQCVGSQTLGARTRSRTIVRKAVRPHGHCLSELKQSESCILVPCYTYSASLVGNTVECVRSDSLLVDDHHCRGHTQQFSQSGSHHGCQPPCQVPHSECGADLKCHCTRGHHPTYLPAPILSSRPPTLVFCQILDSGAILGSNAAMANGTGPHPGDNPMVTDHNTTVPISYFPDDSQLNHWMLAMIGIGCIFIAFVGVSIYLMCKSTNQEAARVPKD